MTYQRRRHQWVYGVSLVCGALWTASAGPRAADRAQTEAAPLWTSFAGVPQAAHDASAGGGCQNDAECADTNPCTRDTCILKICVHTTIPGCRRCATPSDCADGDPCTDDVCTPAGACANPDAPDGTSCADGRFCNGDEVCTSGQCSDRPDPCADLDHCDEQDDACLECLTDDECTDADPCTQDACVDHACMYTLLPGCAVGVRLDIKPRSCPNPFQVASRGVLPMALAGSADFDVTAIDLNSLVLVRSDGVGGSVGPLRRNAAPRAAIEDVTAPFTGERCACAVPGPDGFDDLLIRFSTRETVRRLMLRTLPKGTMVELSIHGTLRDGSEFTASDCLRILRRPGDGDDGHEEIDVDDRDDGGDDD